MQTLVNIRKFVGTSTKAIVCLLPAALLLTGCGERFEHFVYTKNVVVAGPIEGSEVDSHIFTVMKDRTNGTFSAPVDLTNGPYSDTVCGVMDDGRIAFHRFSNGSITAQVMIMNGDGSGLRVLSGDSNVDARCSAVTPSKQVVVVEIVSPSLYQYRYSLVGISPDTGERNLFFTPGMPHAPEFMAETADRHEIVFYRDIEKNTRTITSWKAGLTDPVVLVTRASAVDANGHEHPDLVFNSVTSTNRVIYSQTFLGDGKGYRDVMSVSADGGLSKTLSDYVVNEHGKQFCGLTSERSRVVFTSRYETLVNPSDPTSPKRPVGDIYVVSDNPQPDPYGRIGTEYDGVPGTGRVIPSSFSGGWHDDRCLGTASYDQVVFARKRNTFQFPFPDFWQSGLYSIYADPLHDYGVNQPPVGPEFLLKAAASDNDLDQFEVHLADPEHSRVIFSTIGQKHLYSAEASQPSSAIELDPSNTSKAGKARTIFGELIYTASSDSAPVELRLIPEAGGTPETIDSGDGGISLAGAYYTQ